VAEGRKRRQNRHSFGRLSFNLLYRVKYFFLHCSCLSNLAARSCCFTVQNINLFLSISRIQERTTTTRTLRSSDTLLLTVPFTRTELAKRAFRCAAPSVWNSLPSFIINSGSLTTFKSRRLKTYFFRYLSTVAYTSDPITFPPAPLKLQPYVAI